MKWANQSPLLHSQIPLISGPCPPGRPSAFRKPIPHEIRTVTCSKRVKLSFPFMINLFLGGFHKKGEGEDGGKSKKRKHASRCVVTCKLFFFFFLNAPSALEPTYLLREKQNSFFDKVSC